MSDNKYNRTRKSNAQKTRDANFLEDAKARLKSKFVGQLTPVDVLLRKAQDVASKVHEAVKPTVLAGGWKDEAAMKHLILTLYLEAFDTTQLFTREDLVQICAMLHTDAMMKTIQDDPGLHGKPDLLSGA